MHPRPYSRQELLGLREKAKEYTFNALLSLDPPVPRLQRKPVNGLLPDQMAPSGAAAPTKAPRKRYDPMSMPLVDVSDALPTSLIQQAAPAIATEQDRRAPKMTSKQPKGATRDPPGLDFPTSDTLKRRFETFNGLAPPLSLHTSAPAANEIERGPSPNSQLLLSNFCPQGNDSSPLTPQEARENDTSMRRLTQHAERVKPNAMAEEAGMKLGKTRGHEDMEPEVGKEPGIQPAEMVQPRSTGHVSAPKFFSQLPKEKGDQGLESGVGKQKFLKRSGTAKRKNDEAGGDKEMERQPAGTLCEATIRYQGTKETNNPMETSQNAGLPARLASSQRKEAVDTCVVLDTTTAPTLDSTILPPSKEKKVAKNPCFGTNTAPSSEPTPPSLPKKKGATRGPVSAMDNTLSLPSKPVPSALPKGTECITTPPPTKESVAIPPKTSKMTGTEARSPPSPPSLQPQTPSKSAALALTTVQVLAKMQAELEKRQNLYFSIEDQIEAGKEARRQYSNKKDEIVRIHDSKLEEVIKKDSSDVNGFWVVPGEEGDGAPSLSSEKAAAATKTWGGWGAAEASESRPEPDPHAKFESQFTGQPDEWRVDELFGLIRETEGSHMRLEGERDMGRAQETGLEERLYEARRAVFELEEEIKAVESAVEVEKKEGKEERKDVADVEDKGGKRVRKKGGKKAGKEKSKGGVC
ncbi:hypothetical protein MMC28_007113 [Mycoblastus sanguinarius]|nr:hypothetical protein [Mycoblastus sanguinarius]